jgi:type VI secretion system secreted protein VgrG
MPEVTRNISVAVEGFGDKDFFLEDFEGSEALSELFRFQVTMLAGPETKVEFDKILGQGITIKLVLANEKDRFFHGVIYRFAQGPQVRSADSNKPRILCTADILPKFGLLKNSIRSRIYQQKSVPDILKDVLKDIKDIDWKIQGQFEPRDYCVQYRESDFDFASRLMEEEGIFYFFKHEEKKHTMVIGNTSSAHADVPVEKKVEFDDETGGQFDKDTIYEWQKLQEIRSGKYTLRDHCFEMPEKNLEATETMTTSVSVGMVTHKLQVAHNDKLEIYDFPGRYANRFDGVSPGGGDQASKLSKIEQDNTRTVKIRMDQETAPALTLTGQSSCGQFTAGHKFTLQNHYNANGDYVFKRVRHTANMRGTSRGGKATGVGGKLQYQNQFECLPAALLFRPLQVTPKGRVDGPQTAVVVGPSDQEIFTDKYGRVKVQFFWDREGKKDTNSSCWVRVGTLWAGKQWGMIHIPRIGQEVIVAFLEGDPDQPIVVGSVYNADQMPPYTLPDNRTQSGVKTRSSLKGTEDTYNELRFEDKKDSEEIYFHAQKDFVRVVENNDLLQVGYMKKDGDHDSKNDGSQKIKVYKDRDTELETGNETLTIDKGNRTVTVKKGDDKHEVSKGKRDVIVEGNDTLVVNTGNCAQTIKKGNLTTSVDTGNDELTVKTGNYTVKVSAGKIGMEAAQSIELKVGGSTVKIEPATITLTSGAHSIKVGAAGIVLNGPKIDIKGGLQVSIQSLMTEVKGNAMLTLKGALTQIN